MANKKSKTKPEKCKAQFARTVKNTGKWRGKSPDKYVELKRKNNNHSQAWQHGWTFLGNTKKKNEE